MSAMYVGEADQKSIAPVAYEPVAKTALKNIDAAIGGRGVEPRQSENDSAGKNTPFSASELVQLQNTVTSLNELTGLMNRAVHFRIHDGTNTLQIEVVDTKTKEVIRSIPPQQMLDQAAKREEFLGMIISGYA